MLIKYAGPSVFWVVDRLRHRRKRRMKSSRCWKLLAAMDRSALFFGICRFLRQRA
jgi:hypothetical protein